MDNLARDASPESENALLTEIIRCNNIVFQFSFEFFFFLTGPQNTRAAQINTLYVESGVKIVAILVRIETCFDVYMRENSCVMMTSISEFNHTILL